MEKKLCLPIDEGFAESLEVGDYVLLSGEMYVARDAAHKRLIELWIKIKNFHLILRIKQYIMGPSPSRPG